MYVVGGLGLGPGRNTHDVYGYVGGNASYLVPLLGESFDLVWAPMQALLMSGMFDKQVKFVPAVRACMSDKQTGRALACMSNETVERACLHVECIGRAYYPLVSADVDDRPIVLCKTPSYYMHVHASPMSNVPMSHSFVACLPLHSSFTPVLPSPLSAHAPPPPRLSRSRTPSMWVC